MALAPLPRTAAVDAGATRWLRVAAGCGVAVAAMAFGPWSGAEEPDGISVASDACTNVLGRQAPELGGGVQQAITVSVPAMAIVDLVDGMPSSVWTNSGRPPTPGDEMYVRHDQEFTEASPTIRDEVLHAAWLPVVGQGCEPESWVAAPRL